ncbi:hypothetical protein Q5H92_13040 [Hymenobacter sp. M29]|uniref:Uncharacterized protein n=1 Tax=Hymenobacter mellowenesis TaxID=3063995 RepID=A0ABT9ABS5_9BACT|nr:hypothetical protein [Hymenobacter sp. M29]MDO7847291.1 hypothetical protein [Hymenobacter sp. M29]
MSQLRWILLAPLLLSHLTHAQRCVPHNWLFDRQIVTHDGGLLLMQTQVGPFYMLYAYGAGNELELHILNLGPDGQTRHDSVRHLLWPEWKYHYTWHPDTALGRSQPLLTPDTVGGLHEAYLSALTWRAIDLGYRGGWNQARRLTKLEIVWDPMMPVTGRPILSWQARDVGQRASLPPGFVRNPFPRRLLDQRFPYLKPTVPTFTLAGPDRILLLGDAAYLRPAAPAQPDNNPTPPANWLVQGPNWQLTLDGYIDLTAPLVSMAPGRRLYVTVVHNEVRSCAPFQDTWPIIYCIDLRRGKVLWQRQPSERQEINKR